jgi:Uma2 family endonuclease
MTTAQSEIGQQPLILHTRPMFEMSDELFFNFCQANREWRIERTAEGEVQIMPPTGWETGASNSRLNAFLTLWSLQDGTGITADSSTGFILPNGAIHSPDAAWVRRSRLAAFTPEQKRRFLPLCPDFVVELRSASDHLQTLQAKMQEYVDNGAQLGWLFDSPNRRVYVYRPGKTVECLENPETLIGDPELPGFVLDLTKFWTSD